MGKPTTPFHVLAKPAGAACNLACSYCFYLSKQLLYQEQRLRMPDDVLEAYVRGLVTAQHNQPIVSIAWQGGEPTLAGLDFFRRAVDLAESLIEPGQQIEYSIQTNGTLIDSEWAAFFADKNFLVGISIDGPEPLHDHYRVTVRGRGSYDSVIRGYNRLREHGVNLNILCTVHAANQRHPVEVYRFFRDELEAEFIQFIPIVERAQPACGGVDGGASPAVNSIHLYEQEGRTPTSRSVDPLAYGDFLIGVFDEWIAGDVGRVFVQQFDVALANWHGEPPGLCVFSETCGRAVALEHNGDVYSCDHYVEPKHRLGNIVEINFAEMIDSDQQQAFGDAKRDTLPTKCQRCAYRFACHGGCPKDRLDAYPDGSGDINYLCEGYLAFFRHIDKPMRLMSQLLSSGRRPADAMQILRDERESRYRGVGRNQQCPCGSGRKYKQCHLVR